MSDLITYVVRLPFRLDLPQELESEDRKKIIRDYHHYLKKREGVVRARTREGALYNLTHMVAFGNDVPSRVYAFLRDHADEWVQPINEYNELMEGSFTVSETTREDKTGMIIHAYRQLVRKERHAKGLPPYARNTIDDMAVEERKRLRKLPEGELQTEYGKYWNPDGTQKPIVVENVKTEDLQKSLF